MRSAIFCFFLLFFAGCTQKQTIIVTQVSQNDATLEFYENDNLLLKTNAKIGRNGVAKLNSKKEGDGKTPSGEYSITALFAYEKQNANMPFLYADENLICVDDVNSSFYNQILDKNNASSPQSYEDMKRADNQYKYGAVIGYNLQNEKGAGSCIFLHIYKDENSSTAGCVAVSEDEMKFMFDRLDESKMPKIIIAN